ncbi:MAG: GAF domain-containing sensor histidine kinase [Leptolyngbya sp. DLM2.Bin27]|nr:MAG: GAF domain-containing sensor histidine kinase [Leptolyngbya sp. DLM2.Bin27]
MGVPVFSVLSEGEFSKGVGASPGRAQLPYREQEAGQASGGPTCPWPGLPWAQRQPHQAQILAALGLGDLGSVPPWEEAAQVAAQFLAMPIAVVTLADGNSEYIRAAYGLSSLGVGNPLSQQRQLPLNQGLGLYVLDSRQPLVLPDAADNAVTARSEWVATYGIRAYCGVPLITSQGLCIGTLAVMDRQPHRFTEQELAFVAMAARWGMSEYERYWATAVSAAPARLGVPESPQSLEALMNAVRLNLVSHLTEELRNPLATVLGMASMLSREIYGPLTQKQREYTDIVCHSSQTLMTQVNEIIDLGLAPTGRPGLVPTAVDIRALGQQVINTLTPLAEKSAQAITFTVEPNEDHWILDQRTVKQILYHLTFSILQVAGEHSNLCIHACRRGQALSLMLWLANPWLGEGLPTEVFERFHPPASMTECLPGVALSGPKPDPVPQDLLGLLLSQHLALRHGGEIRVQGSADNCCRLVVTLPVLDAAKARPEVKPRQCGVEA